MRTVDLTTTFVYVIDSSLGMSKGKIAAQVSHVAMSLADMYKCHGRAIVLKASHERFAELASMNFATCIRDTGLTQVPPGTMTCLGFKQTDENKALVSDLKLL